MNTGKWTNRCLNCHRAPGGMRRALTLCERGSLVGVGGWTNWQNENDGNEPKEISG